MRHLHLYISDENYNKSLLDFKIGAREDKEIVNQFKKLFNELPSRLKCMLDII